MSFGVAFINISISESDYTYIDLLLRKRKSQEWSLSSACFKEGIKRHKTLCAVHLSNISGLFRGILSSQQPTSSKLDLGRVKTKESDQLLYMWLRVRT